MKKIALVTGSSGQDGTYLCKFLLEKKYKVIAADRRSSRNNNWRHNYLGLSNDVIYEDFDLLDFDSIVRLFKKYKFDEVYNLAAQSFVKTSFNTPISTSNVTAIGPLKILEVIRFFSKSTKFYQASSSEMYGLSNDKIQDEKTKFEPRSPYAISKLYAHHITKNYREAYSIFACSGILFNHESPIRGEEFVTRKITKQLCEIKLGKRNFIEVGNIEARRDWGYAPDYIEAMWKMMQYKKADDYVIATNKTYSVKEFINFSCKALGMNIKWVGKGLDAKCFDQNTKKMIIKVNKKFFRPTEVNYLRGNYKKAKKILGWKPKTNLKDMIRLMINYDLKN